MSLTRKLLKGMGLTEEQIDSVIDAHTETVDGLKAQINTYKADAEKLADVQRQLDEATGRKDYKADYEKALKDLNDYKAEIAGKEKLAAVKAAYKKLLAEKKVGDKYQDSVMGVTDFSGMELDEGGTLKNAEALGKDIETRWNGFIPTITTQGAKPETPPAQNGGSGANPRAAEIARQRHERLYGKPQEGDNNK